MVTTPVYCPKCGAACDPQQRFCGNCRFEIAPVVAMVQRAVQAGPAAKPAAAPQNAPRLIAQPGQSMWFANVPRPVSARDWGLFSLQALLPLGFLLILVSALAGSWSREDPGNPFRLLVMALSLVTVLVWLIALVLPAALRTANWQYLAGGCVAVPAVLIVAVSSAFILTAMIAAKYPSVQPFLACIGGLFPFGAVAYLLARRA